MKRTTVVKAKVAQGGARLCMLGYEGVTKYANCISRCMKCKNATGIRTLAFGQSRCGRSTSETAVFRELRLFPIALIHVS